MIREESNIAVLLKDIYNRDFLFQFGYKINSVSDAFNTEKFLNAVMENDWDSLTLGLRRRRICEKLRIFLPNRYEETLKILYSIADSCVGFPYLFFPDFVAMYGQAEEHWALSMNALECFTQKSSSEFAVRPFILREPKRMINQMAIWAKHPNEHVRRLASEGCRPRLPWGKSLPVFKNNPAPVLSILELLKADPSLYVRKSVANNLNDIAKDNPDLVLETATRWKGKNPHTDWIIRRGCRTLIRKADPNVMALFGYADTSDIKNLVASATLSVDPCILPIGGSCQLHYNLHLLKDESVHIRLEYGIDFVKANGSISRKLFLLSDKITLGGQNLTGVRKHSWSNLTTRRHYPGEHRITLLVNGQEVAVAILGLLPAQ